MAIFYSFFLLFVAASTVVAAPAADIVLERRATDRVCGASFSQKGTYDKCVMDTVFQRTNSTLVSKKSFVNQKLPKGVLCRRVMGTVITQGVADKSGLCDIIDKWHKVDKNVTASTLLTSARDHINGKENVVFLDDKVDKRKASIVTSTLKGKKATKWDQNLNKATKTYLTGVDGTAKNVAKSVDKDFADIVAKAQKRVDELFPKDSKDKKQSKEAKKFRDAVKKYKKNITMEDTWNKVVKSV